MILSYDMILENLQRTDKHTENSKPEATLIPVDRRGERSNMNKYFNSIFCHYRGNGTTFKYIVPYSLPKGPV